MTAVSLTINNGVDGFKNSDITVGTAAPTSTWDFEFRFNLVDQGSPSTHNITAKECVIALKAFIRAIETGGANVDVTTGILGPP